ncbi:hypothetical protein AGMMS4952_03610 [Spirochaetia bacterium]|nr:hypothetical protein AGMMS4952_03610 [Spirochaetia bacterium]
MKRMMQFILFFIVSTFVFLQVGRAQDIQPGQLQDIELLALSKSNYQVTAGDVYTLTYNDTVEVITVDYSYRLSFPGLGAISGEGKTYPQLKREVETIITTRYPQSGAQFTLTRASTFVVYIKGEVSRAGERITSAIGRLSSLVAGDLTQYSSTRNITVTAINGQVKTYDLFKAQRFGDLGDDPYLRPGDVITVNPLDRKVSVFGQVKRPGTYELMPGENLRELIQNFANGYSSRGDPGRVELTRYIENNDGVAETIYLTREEINADYPLQDSDAVYIPLK